MKFYDCSPAPSPRRVRLFVCEKEIEIPVVQVDLSNGEQLGEAFLGINPDGTVPVLELDDGTKITEALAICQYLEDTVPNPPLFGRDARERALSLMWNAKIEQQGLAAIAELFRNRSKAFRNRALPGPVAFEQIPALIERGRIRAEQFFDRVNAHLANNRFMIGDVFTLADITLLVATDFAAWSKIAIGDQRGNLQRWYDEVSTRPAVQKAGR